MQIRLVLDNINMKFTYTHITEKGSISTVYIIDKNNKIKSYVKKNKHKQV